MADEYQGDPTHTSNRNHLMSGGGGTGVNTYSSDFMNIFGGYFTLYKKSTPGSRGSGKAKKSLKKFLQESNYTYDEAKAKKAGLLD